MIQQLFSHGAEKIIYFFKQHISYQAVLVLSIISFVTSYYGFISLVSDKVLLTKILFFAVVGVIQVALVYSISQLYLREFFSRYFLRASLLLATYLLSLFISVLFSFNFYYKIFSADEFSQRNVTLQLEAIKQNLEDAQSSFNGVYLSLKDLSDYSMKRSIEERTYGGTCDETKIPQPGPRSALREFESKLFQSHLGSVASLKENVTQEILAIKKIVQAFSPKEGNTHQLEEQVNHKIIQINRLLRGGEIALLPKVLVKHSDEKRMKMHSLGRVISCPDSRISLKINTIIEHLSSLKPLTKVSFFDASDQQQLIERTINVLLAIIPFTNTQIVSIDKVSSPTDVTQSDIKAIGLGFLVDFFIFFFTILSKEPYRARFFTQKSIKHYYKYDVRRILTPFVFEGHFSYHIIVPNQRNLQKVDELVALFQMDKMLTLVGNNIPYKELLSVHQSKLKAFDNSTFKVYKLEKKKYIAFLVHMDEIYHDWCHLGDKT